MKALSSVKTLFSARIDRIEFTRLLAPDVNIIEDDAVALDSTAFDCPTEILKFDSNLFSRDTNFDSP